MQTSTAHHHKVKYYIWWFSKWIINSRMQENRTLNETTTTHNCYTWNEIMNGVNYRQRHTTFVHEAPLSKCSWLCNQYPVLPTKNEITLYCASQCTWVLFSILCLFRFNFVSSLALFVPCFAFSLSLITTACRWSGTWCGDVRLRGLFGIFCVV